MQRKKFLGIRKGNTRGTVLSDNSIDLDENECENTINEHKEASIQDSVECTELGAVEKCDVSQSPGMNTLKSRSSMKTRFSKNNSARSTGVADLLEGMSKIDPIIISEEKGMIMENSLGNTFGLQVCLSANGATMDSVADPRGPEDKVECSSLFQRKFVVMAIIF